MPFRKSHVFTVNPELFNDEKVLWRGRPFRGIIFRRLDLFLIPLSALWSGFAIYWNILALRTAIVPNIFIGFPFLLIGLYVVVGRFILDIKTRQNLHYFVTNKRVIIMNSKFGDRAKSLDIHHLSSLELDERSDGTGNIRFGTSSSWLAGNNLGMWQQTLDSVPQFIRIMDARAAYHLIRDISRN